jgi:hypothetical protein
MKIRVTMKTPDVVENAICSAVDDMTDDFDQKYDEKERLQKIFAKWFEYGEYLTVYVDTDTKTIEVAKAGRG